MCNRNRQPNRGVVLLVVLGMLGLFSVLIVSYVVYSSQMRDTSFASSTTRLSNVTPKPPINAAINTLIAGTSDPKSAAFGHSLLEDLYGTDGLSLRVAHRRMNASTGSAMPAAARGALLRPLDGQGRPQSTLFKFPVGASSANQGDPPVMAQWHDDGNDAQATTLYQALSTLPTSGSDNYLHQKLDDVFAGRLATFIEGPLAGHTFRVIRSFGTDNDDDAVEEGLAGCFVIDLSELPDEQLLIDSESVPLYETAATAPNRLLYSAGADGEPGRAGIDDNDDNTRDDFGELGAQGSDDIGYRFILNGQVFNGRGQNPEGVTGIQRDGKPNLDSQAHLELSPNAALTGSTARADTGGGGTFPEPDEQYDAPDFENMFLAWQPSDHRRAYGQTIYSGANADELNRQLGQNIIPSFHRPAVINYLMNAPIRLPGEGAGVKRNFADLDATDPDDGKRLVALIRRLRRATMRPLNFEHLFFGAANSDLDGDGDPYDGAPSFSGSNPAPILSETIQTDRIPTDPNTFLALKEQIRRLAIWLINGPWDVDNDGDGLPDSVWVDLNLPAVQSPDGRMIKPMIAPLIEDLDGRININVAGNYNQLRMHMFETDNWEDYNNDAQYVSVNRSLGTFGRGGGVGPAEIDFSHLFDEQNKNVIFNGPRLGPVFHTQTSGPLGNLLLRSRYGNLLNARYGGQIFDYFAPYPTPDFTKLPGLGDFNAPEPNRDLLARIPFAGRSASQNVASPMGRPVDMSGRSQTRQDRFGNQVFDHFRSGAPQNPSGFNEIVNQPYEIGIDAPRGDDQPFTPAELHDFMKGGELAGRLSQLLGDAADSNEALRRILTTESRSLDVPEIMGEPSILHLMIDKLSVSGDEQMHLDRMLAVELRKGSKLNLNRPVGNGTNDNSGTNDWTDETYETEPQLNEPTPTRPNQLENRWARENAFPQIQGEYPKQAAVRARYVSATHVQNDFDGIDTDGNGTLDSGTVIGGVRYKVASGQELLARHLYCLMFSLIADPGASPMVEHFPYPPNFNGSASVADRYVARRLAQWAVNAVDYRDTDAICTRLRYDPNPFDGFDLPTAAENVVWGMERPELELTETLAFHDKRLRRNLETDADGDGRDEDGQIPEDTSDKPNRDEDMDQFRIPEASAFVELHSLRTPVANDGETQPSYPQELYSFNGRDPYLDLGRWVGQDEQRSPVWRLAVGQATQGEGDKSTRWVFDAERVGEKLVAGDPPRPEELDYLTTPLDGDEWADDQEVQQAVDEWRENVGFTAEVRVSQSPGGKQEFVTIADEDLDPATNPTEYRIELDRFVWFADLDPRGTGGTPLNVITDPRSGMTLGNVFFNPKDPANTSDLTRPRNARPRLAPGQYAVVGPRPETRFGQTELSTAANDYAYHPSEQMLQFANYKSINNEFVFRLSDLSGTDRNPEFGRFGEDPNNAYDVYTPVPIIARALYPHEVAGTGAPELKAWADYVSNNSADDRVRIGFNISAPESGATYYLAPEHRIYEGGPDDTYPLVDGYRDYNDSEGYHPDTPLDHKANTPMDDYGWNAVGTHQEARTVFLQRLADPTSPWHPIDNPYVTVDFMPMDLTTFNGEHDVREMIDHDENPMTPDVAVDRAKTNWDDDADEFTPNLRFDSRRKIPDVDRDRAVTVMLPKQNSDPNSTNLNRKVRVAMPKRSAMSASFSVLRNVGELAAPITPTPYWPFSLGSMWKQGDVDDQVRGSNATVTAQNLDTSYRAGLIDEEAYPFRQSLGFVNREYGQPVQSDRTRASELGIGTPDGTILTSLPWMDRDFQSPLDLINVPATSRTGLLTQFSPGTQLEDDAKREVAVQVDSSDPPVRFEHLLGFEAGYATHRAADDVAFLEAPESYTAIPPADMDEHVTGKRAGFEQIFDFVDIGPVWFDSQRWFDLNQVTMLKSSSLSNTRDRMFNRVVETLQPPFNYIGQHRTPGRINVNTMPDYIRKGARNTNPPTAFLDVGEQPADPTAPGSSSVSYNRLNDTRDGNGFTSEFRTSDSLFGNGSIYRSLAWGISTAYELDDQRAVPRTLGEVDDPANNSGQDVGYAATVATRFGRGFKGFLESRRGYPHSSTQYNGEVTPPNGPKDIFFQNNQLDWRYPTRFAGVFAPSRSARLPGVQRFMRPEIARETMDPPPEEVPGNGIIRRTHDMSVLRPHPDFDLRTMNVTDRGNVQDPTLDSYSLRVEDDPTVGNPDVNLPNTTRLPTPPGPVEDLRMPLVNRGLFERSQAELHQDFRHLDRSSFFRFQNAARMANLTTHHSNVFMVRLTVGYFVVDPATGAVGQEYVDSTGETLRSKATFMVDRSIPVGFWRGATAGGDVGSVDMNVDDTIIYRTIEE